MRLFKKQFEAQGFCQVANRWPAGASGYGSGSWLTLFWRQHGNVWFFSQTSKKVRKSIRKSRHDHWNIIVLKAVLKTDSVMFSSLSRSAWIRRMFRHSTANPFVIWPCHLRNVSNCQELMGRVCGLHHFRVLGPPLTSREATLVEYRTLAFAVGLVAAQAQAETNFNGEPLRMEETIGNPKVRTEAEMVKCIFKAFQTLYG